MKNINIFYRDGGSFIEFDKWTVTVVREQVTEMRLMGENEKGADEIGRVWELK